MIVWEKIRITFLILIFALLSVILVKNLITSPPPKVPLTEGNQEQAN